MALDGWEPSDKPLYVHFNLLFLQKLIRFRDEHFNRSPDCPFFRLIDEHNAELASKRSTSKKGRPSKASRLSTQSAVSVAGDVADDEGDSILSTATTNVKTSALKGRKTKAKKIEPALLSTQSAITIASNATLEEGDSIISTSTTKGKRGRKGKVQNTEVAEDPRALAASSTRGRKRKSDDEASQPDLSENPVPKRRTTRASTTRVPQASAAPLRKPTFAELQDQAAASDMLWMEGSPPQSTPPLSPPQSPPQLSPQLSPHSPPRSPISNNQISDTEPQSSDAENHLPEKPNTPPNQHFTAPESTKQWEAIDVEMFFGDEEHEHFVNALSKLKTGQLSKAESKMSVEQWIYHTAELAQEKLREECERMVAAFEAEGLKALACLEAIQIV